MIEIIHQRENEDDITVFFKIDIKEEAESIEWHADMRPKDADPQAYLKNIEDKLHFLILQKMYRGGDTWADWQRFKTDENTELEAMQEWIKAGHKNKIQTGLTKAGKPKYGYRIIEKQPWKSTHPPELAVAKDIDALDVKEDLKKVLKKVIMT